MSLRTLLSKKLTTDKRPDYGDFVVVKYASLVPGQLNPQISEVVLTGHKGECDSAANRLGAGYGVKPRRRR